MSDVRSGSNSIKKIKTIALNAFREAVRDRILYNLVIFVLLITAAAIFLGDLTAGQEARTIVNLGLGAILVFGTFISIFVGVSLVSKEIEKKTVYAIFSKPIGRGEFITGKYLGLCLTLFVNVMIMGCGLSLALLFVGGGNLAFRVWGATLLIFYQLVILTAVAILFSSFSSPALSALLTFLIFLIAHFSTALRELSATLGSSASEFLFTALYYLLPNFSTFSFAANASRGEFPSLALLGGGAVYTCFYVAALLAMTILIFNRRNFK
ncbi:MAG: ABC transporter permease subunit [Pyrinomonadaceae bacterium]|nr:ABC transporter permease subunit [Pyrinomonadaceae bacterium]